MGEKVSLGAVIEIATSRGYAYALYTHRHDKPPTLGALLRVFSRTFIEQQSKFEWMESARPQFDAFFPLNAALKEGIVRVAGYIEIPPWARSFPIFRTGAINKTTKKVDVWWLWDGEKEWRVGSLSEEQRRLSIRGVVNDTLLKERIVNGWTPETDTR